MAEDQNKGPIDFDEWSKKLRGVNKDIGDRFRMFKGLKGGLTKPRIALIIIILLIIVFFAVIAPFANFYTDALWYNHLGFQNLFWKMFWAKIIMVLIFGAFFFIVLYGNVVLARRLGPKQQVDLEGSPLKDVVDKVRGTWKRIVFWISLVFCVVAAFVAGLSWGGKWELVLRWMNHSNFAVKDPVFHKNVGYYVFNYPFYRDLVNWLLGVVFFVLIITAVVYLLDGGIRFKRGPEMFAPFVKAHLSLLLGVIFIIKAWSYRLNMYELLFSKGGVVSGAGYTDVNAHLPALWILLVISLVCAAILIANIWRKGWLLPAIAVGALIVVTLLANALYPYLVQQLHVKPNESKLEAPYLARNIDFTRRAYKLNEVKTTEFAANLDLDAAGIVANQATIRNIRLWAPAPILNVFQQLQAIRQYYTFYDADVDRYVVDGVYRQTLLGARELLISNLPAAARTWVNNTLVYTHGFGAVVSPSNDVTAEGNPDFFLKDIPPAGPTNLQVKRPQIYFGEKQSGYIAVNTTQQEFDYPLPGNQTQSTVYTGTGGVKVNSIFRKFLFAVRFADINLLFSGQVKDTSQLMWVRDISERVQKCAPFLRIDADPYMVLGDDGKLFWIQDCYTTSPSYPYSSPSAGLGNYVRNSVKAVVDAYEGTVKLYVMDPTDPIIRTYQKIWPHIFTSLSQMPPDVRKHLRYPEDLFVAQANIYRTFHMTNPQQFYGKEDEWDFATETIGNTTEPMSPYYAIMKLPGEQGEEMVLFEPFTPHNKQNMISWVGARMDGVHYGEMINYRFPSGVTVLGPEQVRGRIDQDPNVSAQLTLLNQQGSQVIKGNLLVIPINQSLLYVEPLYLQATSINIPQVKRVVVAFGNRVVMGNTLQDALLTMFAGAPSAVQQPSAAQPTTSPQQAQLAAQALDLYNRAIAAQKAGDWAGYGQLLQQLQSVLQQLAGQTPAQ